MEAQYVISSNVSFLRDSPKNIEYHIDSDDYFLHVATLIGAMEEALANVADNEYREHHSKLAREVRNDLRYVQANYKIIPRPLADIQIIRPSGNLLSD